MDVLAAFRLNIDGIDDMQYANKIDSFTIKQGVKKLYTGDRSVPADRADEDRVPDHHGHDRARLRRQAVQVVRDLRRQGRSGSEGAEVRLDRVPLDRSRQDALPRSTCSRSASTDLSIVQIDRERRRASSARSSSSTSGAWTSTAPASRPRVAQLRRRGDHEVVEHVRVDRVRERAEPEDRAERGAGDAAERERVRGERLAMHARRGARPANSSDDTTIANATASRGARCGSRQRDAGRRSGRAGTPAPRGRRRRAPRSTDDGRARGRAGGRRRARSTRAERERVDRGLEHHRHRDLEPQRAPAIARGGSRAGSRPRTPRGRSR